MFKEALCFKSSWSSRERDPLSDNDQCSVKSCTGTTGTWQSVKVYLGELGKTSERI